MKSASVALCLCFIGGFSQVLYLSWAEREPKYSGPHFLSFLISYKFLLSHGVGWLSSSQEGKGFGPRRDGLGGNGRLFSTVMLIFWVCAVACSVTCPLSAFLVGTCWSPWERVEVGQTVHVYAAFEGNLYSLCSSRESAEFSVHPVLRFL